MRIIFKYYISFESQYGVPYVQAQAKCVVEKMNKSEFLFHLSIASYPLFFVSVACQVVSIAFHFLFLGPSTTSLPFKKRSMPN